MNKLEKKLNDIQQHYEQLAEQEGEDDGIDTGEHYHVLSQDALWDAFGEERALAWRWMRLAMDVLDTESNSAD